jgi:penicillin-binding protein 2
LVSYPSYDNNKISDYEYYQELLNDPTKPLYPTATQGKTAPGSTFKMMSAVAGLEEGVITKNDRVTCTGTFTKVSPNVACWISSYGGGHGSINVVTAIAVSCNSFFNEVGYRLGITEDGSYSPLQGVQKLSKYAAMFGLDTTTGIELIESKPSIPGTTTTGIVNPVTAAMGQEFNSYTPTQIARYIATLANGGTLYELTLIDRIYNSDGSLYLEQEPTITQVNEFKEGTIETVHEGMIEVTTGSRGTARTYYADFPILVGGKTGTAQENKQRASHAVFASFAPADDPEIAIVVAIPYSYTAPFSSGYIVGTVARDLYGVYYDIYSETDGYSYKQEMKID